jgi:hypothetical protein
VSSPFLTVYPVQFTFASPANLLRGKLGKLLHHTNKDAYDRIFAPRLVSGPSGIKDPPRPFVLRPPDTINIFERAAIIEIEAAFPGQTRQLPPIECSVDTSACATRLQVEFLTPTEIKAEGRVLREPLFEPLFARARDRVGALCALYQQALPDIDYAALGERAKSVVMTRCDIRRVDLWRQSRRTGQTHSLGGFIGTAEYKGDLTDFLPWLRAAQYTGVGRLTVWGNGWIRL